MIHIYVNVYVMNIFAYVIISLYVIVYISKQRQVLSEDEIRRAVTSAVRLQAGRFDPNPASPITTEAVHASLDEAENHVNDVKGSMEGEHTPETIR
jgi:hypothetical protein